MREATPSPFRQPDATSCGSAVVVRARMLTDAGYDRWVRSAPDPVARFVDETVRTHRRTNRLRDGHGRLQLPWPAALGTHPWSLARELAGSPRPLLVLDRARAWTRIARSGRPTALYLGNRSLPRHVVLVVHVEAHTARVYEPTSGSTVTIERRSFLEGSLALAGWDRPWFVLA